MGVGLPRALYTRWTLVVMPRLVVVWRVEQLPRTCRLSAMMQIVPPEDE